jgi:hypothetical protein
MVTLYARHYEPRGKMVTLYARHYEPWASNENRILGGRGAKMLHYLPL